MSAYEIGDIDTKIKQIFEKDKKKSLDTLVKILTNIDENPNEKKYKALKKSNAAFSKVLADIPDALWFLKIAGFVDNADVIVCPENADIERLREVLNHIKSAILIYESINPSSSPYNNPYTNPNPVPTTSTFPSAVNNVNNANLPALGSLIANAALFKDWSENMTKGENEFIKSKNVMSALQFFEKALRSATQIYEQEKSNFYAGLITAVSYASMADCYYVNGLAEQTTDCAMIGKHYLNTTMAENPTQVFNPEIHMFLSKTYLVLAKASYSGAPNSLNEVENYIAIAWRHAQLSPTGMPKVIAEHNVACWSMRFYKSLSSQGMNYNQQFTHWYVIHEAVKHGHL